MTDIYLVATLIDKLDDVEAILGLHNLGDLTRVCKIKGNSSKGRVKRSTPTTSVLS